MHPRHEPWPRCSHDEMAEIRGLVPSCIQGTSLGHVAASHRWRASRRRQWVASKARALATLQQTVSVVLAARIERCIQGTSLGHVAAPPTCAPGVRPGSLHPRHEPWPRCSQGQRWRGVPGVPHVASKARALATLQQRGLGRASAGDRVASKARALATLQHPRMRLPQYAPQGVASKARALATLQPPGAPGRVRGPRGLHPRHEPWPRCSDALSEIYTWHARVASKARALATLQLFPTSKANPTEHLVASKARALATLQPRARGVGWAHARPLHPRHEPWPRCSF